jgi:hypothetical protein
MDFGGSVWLIVEHKEPQDMEFLSLRSLFKINEQLTRFVRRIVVAVSAHGASRNSF